MPSVAVRLTRVSPTHHRLEILREQGACESVQLETKTFLFHDFLHFALESEARLANSFFGKLASGQSYADVTAKGIPLAGEVLDTERVLGPLTGVVRGEVEVGDFHTGLANMFEALGEPIPAWVTDELIAAVSQRYRAMVGQWKATPFGQAMELKFPV